MPDANTRASAAVVSPVTGLPDIREADRRLDRLAKRSEATKPTFPDIYKPTAGADQQPSKKEETVAKRKNLILMRAGTTSLHASWFTDDREFDLVVDTYAPDPSIWEGTCDQLFPGMGATSSPAFFRILSENPQWLDEYESVWFPDDDIETTTESINLLFRLHKDVGADLSQPALSSDSYWSHAITLQHLGFSIRATNFVEVMIPMFSARALKACLETFDQSKSGWGLDFVWPKIVSDFGGNVAIFDCLPVKHTRPVGGGSAYDGLEESPREEMARLMAKYGVDASFTPQVAEAWDENFEAINPRQLAMRLSAGFPPHKYAASSV